MYSKRAKMYLKIHAENWKSEGLGDVMYFPEISPQGTKNKNNNN